MPNMGTKSNALDDRVWLTLLEPMLRDDPLLADLAAKLWHHLLAEIESGPEGVTRVAGSLETALRLTFPFTKTYRACMILFQVSLGDDFPPKDDSLELLSEAIARVRTALKRATRSPRRKRTNRNH